MNARPAAGRVAVFGVVLALGGAWHAVLLLVFLAAVLWADEIGAAAARALTAALAAVRKRARQRREMNRRRLEVEAALTRLGQALPACAHAHPQDVEDVRDLAGNLVARLCTRCQAQLPPDFEAVKGDR